MDYKKVKKELKRRKKQRIQSKEKALAMAKKKKLFLVEFVESEDYGKGHPENICDVEYGVMRRKKAFDAVYYSEYFPARLLDGKTGEIVLAAKIIWAPKTSEEQIKIINEVLFWEQYKVDHINPFPEFE